MSDIQKTLESYLIEISEHTLFDIPSNLNTYYNKKTSLSKSLSQTDFTNIQTQTSLPLLYYLNSTSKHLRTLIALIIGDVIGVQPRVPLFAIGKTIEIIHNSSLLIDDIQDQGEKRRGIKCAHREFGVDNTISSGCFGFFFGIDFLFGNIGVELTEKQKLRIHESFLAMYLEGHVGNAFDLSNHGGVKELQDYRVDKYEKWTMLKTAPLIILIIKLIEIAYDLKNSQVESLERVVKLICLGFQIMNDLEALDPKNTQFGNDIRERKLSYPMVVFLEGEKNEKGKSEFFQIFNGKTSDESVRRILGILESSILISLQKVNRIQEDLSCLLNKEFPENSHAGMFLVLFVYLKGKMLGNK